MHFNVKQTNKKFYDYLSPQTWAQFRPSPSKNTRFRKRKKKTRDFGKKSYMITFHPRRGPNVVTFEKFHFILVGHHQLTLIIDLKRRKKPPAIFRGEGRTQKTKV
jgi:hypothetical protein